MNNRKPTEHPHIVKMKGSSGPWQSVVKTTSIRVWVLDSQFKRGLDIFDLVEAYPTLSVARVLDALSYAFDHPEEMQEIKRANEAAYDAHLAESSVTNDRTEALSE